MIVACLGIDRKKSAGSSEDDGFHSDLFYLKHETVSMLEEINADGATTETTDIYVRITRENQILLKCCLICSQHHTISIILSVGVF